MKRLHLTYVLIIFCYQRNRKKMKISSSGSFMLVSVAALALFTALSHMSCIVLGPECYRAQMAPEALIELSKSAPWRAALETTLVSLLFVATAIFCLSGG